MSYTDPVTWVAGATLPASDLNTYVRDNFRWLHDRGGDIASAATITPTAGFHKVTGTTTIDNIAAPASGLEVMLWFQSSLTIRNQGGGTGNIRTSVNADEVVAAGEIRTFRSDGTVWKEVGSGSTAGYTLKFDSLLAVNTASIDIQNISGGSHLEAWTYARTDRGSPGDDVGVRCNNDVTANYDKQIARFSSTGPSIGGGEVLGATVLTYQNAATGSTAPAGSYGVARFTFPNYAQAADGKTMSGEYADARGIASGLIDAAVLCGRYRVTGALTRLTFVVSGGGTVYLPGSRFSLYAF